jgi:chemotaxis protein histidine kinase CheA/CheY-like chemotaxis protein
MVLDFVIQNNLEQDFVQEVLGLLQQIHNGLLELPRNYSAAHMRNLVRSTHIVSTATQVNLTEVHNVAYRLEKVFRFLSLVNTEIDSNLMAWLLEADECLRMLFIAKIQGKSDDAAKILAKAEKVFSQLEMRFSNTSETANLKQDVSHLILNTDVVQALENLERILTESQAEKLPEQLKSAANIFLDFGDRLKISEFVAIAHMTIATLKISPQAAETIGRIALVGWGAAYEAVCDKDVTQQITANPPANENKLPLILKTANLFVWVAGETVFTLNSNNIAEILVAEPGQIISSQQQRFLHWREQIIPIYQLSQLFQYSHPLSDKVAASNHQPEPILVLNLGQRIFALEPEIESLIAEPELVINSLPSETKFPNYVYGLTTYKNSLLQVIDVATLLEPTIAESQKIDATAKLFDSVNSAIASKQPNILVVDDSHSVRHLVSLALQKQGYQVLQAQDGQEAIAQLQENSSVQLVICDVEMPKMNGFEFLSYRLKNPLLTKIPVVMLSSCNTNKHRMLAMQLGASNYFTKPYVEKEFLSALKLIVEQESY